MSSSSFLSRLVRALAIISRGGIGGGGEGGKLKKFFLYLLALGRSGDKPIISLLAFLMAPDLNSRRIGLKCMLSLWDVSITFNICQNSVRTCDDATSIEITVQQYLGSRPNDDSKAKTCQYVSIKTEPCRKVKCFWKFFKKMFC